MCSDPSVFWQEMQQMGLLDDIIDQMVQSLYRTRDTAKLFGTNNVASSLTRVASSLNIGDSVMNLISDKQIQKNLNTQMDKPRLSSGKHCHYLLYFYALFVIYIFTCNSQLQTSPA